MKDVIRVSLGEGTEQFHGTIELVQGDITHETTDAIVNAANSELLPGGGVCGAIHRAGGPAIAEECARVRAQGGPVLTGHAVATGAGRLPAKHVIHTVGPVWSGGQSGESEKLASCYRQSIRLADELKLNRISFPAISTGIFGYPVREAAQVAVSAVVAALPATRHVRNIRFVVFDQAAFDAFAAALRAIVNSNRVRSDTFSALP